MPKEFATLLASPAGTARKDALPLTVQSLPDNNEVLSPPGTRCFRGPFFALAESSLGCWTTSLPPTFALPGHWRLRG